MLTSEFNQEMGSLIRSLEMRVAREPSLSHQYHEGPATLDALDHVERAIVTLIALHITLRKSRDR